MHQVRAQDGPNASGFGGILELDGAIHPVGVGAGQRGKPARRGRLHQGIRRGGPDAEREMGVDVEVSKHDRRTLKSYPQIRPIPQIGFG
jgi:hypothetical protein